MSFVNDLVGTWDMVHDGWTGTLVVNPSDQAFNAVEGACVYHGYNIDGSWTGSDNQALGMTGSLGGKDTNRRDGEQCPSSDHMVNFTIAFPGAAPQPFEGYIFTQNHRQMAGFTWWQGQPYAWTASKR